jgi:hypothetical protein
MTSLSLPSHGAAQSASGAASASALASDRSATNQRDAQDGSAFVALLGALDDAGAPTQPVGASVSGNGATAASPAAQTAAEASSAAAWRSVSAVHSLGSGVLIALDKRFGATAAQDKTPASSEAPKAKTGDSAGASAPTTSVWASLLLGVTGATAAPQPPAAGAGATAPAAGGSTPAPLVGDRRAGPRDAGAINKAVMPSDAAPATATPAVVLNAGAPPVDVKVVRSITYLGLDPTARPTNLGRAPASAPSGPGSAASAAAPGREGRENMTPPTAASAKGDSPAMSSGEQSGQNMPSPGGGERAPDKIARPAGAPSTTGGQDATAANAAGAVQITPGAISANGVPLVEIGQLADLVARAARAIDPQSGDASGLARAGASASAASMSPVKELDVQLNPKSLGALSIQMRLSNGNLNITIKAENADTLKLVGNERGAISDRLKSLNFSVESITVNALDTAASTGASGEAAQSGTAGHGEAHQDQSGQAADGSTRGGRSFQGDGDQRDPARPNRGGLGEPGGDGDPGHRFV